MGYLTRRIGKYGQSGRAAAGQSILGQPPSKSQRKRASAALQGLAAELAKLSRDRLKSLRLPDELFEALEVARTIKKGGAHKRQIKYIGGLLRNLDAETIHEQLARLNGKSADARRLGVVQK